MILNPKFIGKAHELTLKEIFLQFKYGVKLESLQVLEPFDFSKN
jgi:hypothetical protein